MLKRARVILVLIGLFTLVTMAQAQSACPGYTPGHNVNLACEIPTATRTSMVAGTGAAGSGSLSSLSPTLAAQLSQLPMATAVSGSGLTLSKSLGVFTASTDSFGTILSQRGDTIGRHNFFLSFTYQRFAFGSIDGIRLRDLPMVNQVNYTDGSKTYTQTNIRTDLRVDQFVALGAFGLTNRIDLAVAVPFSIVTLKTQTLSPYAYAVNPAGTWSNSPMQQAYYPGSASGIGDVTANVKANLFKGEATSVAVGGEVRFPSGDAVNYLGSGAYGVKPYLVISHRGRITPNVNLGYQWNSSSILYPSATGAYQNLPSSFSYTGGADFRVVKNFTLVGEFLGQAVINAPRLGLTTITVDGQNMSTISAQKGTYAMNNMGVGFKASPFHHLLISADVMFKLDDAGLRSKVVPLVGASYRF